MFTKHPLERDVIMIGAAFEVDGKIVHPILAKIICTLSLQALVGAKCVFQKMYVYSVEENCEPATRIHWNISPVEKTNDEIKDFKTDLKKLFLAMKSGDMGESGTDGDETRLMTQTTQSKKPRLNPLLGYGWHKRDPEADVRYKDVIHTFRFVVTQWLILLAFEMKNESDLTRHLINRVVVGLGSIKRAYHKQHGVPLEKMIHDTAILCYEEFIRHVMACVVDK
ncbi:hypothetical protein L1887_13820 [Cichorium endivia]|nr:hypothetical protein L1887_13820 [Cichorium endivia]